MSILLTIADTKILLRAKSSSDILHLDRNKTSPVSFWYTEKVIFYRTLLSVRFCRIIAWWRSVCFEQALCEKSRLFVACELELEIIPLYAYIRERRYIIQVWCCQIRNYRVDKLVQICEQIQYLTARTTSVFLLRWINLDMRI